MKAVCCFVLFVGAGILPVSGASVVWINSAGGNWHTAENWSPNQVPTGADDVSITNAGTYAVAIHSSGVARSITLGGGSGTQTLNMPGAPLVVSNAVSIGPSGVLQALGTLNVFGDVVVRGEFQASSLVLGGAGVLDVTGGQLKVFGLRLSNRVVRNSGTVLIADGHQLFLGDNTAFTNFASGTLIFTNNNPLTHCGIQYDGSFLKTNQFFASEGIVRVHGNSFVEVPGVHRGTIEVAQGQLSLRRHPSYTSFALDVTAACTVAAGATLAFQDASTEFRPPASANGAGSLRVSGGSFNLTGVYGLGGTLICNNGALVSLNTGSPLTLPHVVNESMGDLRGSDPLTITGTLQWSNGGKFSGPAPLLLAATCQTTFERSGTEMHRPFMVNAGTMNWIAADLVLGTNSVFTNLPAATIVMTNNEFGTLTFIRPFTAGSAFHNAGLIRVACENSVECSLPFFNTGTLRAERGQFRLVFTMPFVQSSGATELAGGNLFGFQNTSYSFLGGTLTGSGSIIGGDVTNAGAVVSPGTSPGRINVTVNSPGTPGRYHQLSGGTLNIELAGMTPGTEFDQIVMDGTVTLGGTLNVSLADGFDPPPGTRFLIISGAARTGQFGAFNYPSNQVELQLNYLTNGVELVVGTPGEEIFFVRNLNDSGAGSLRAAISAATVSVSPRRKVHFAITNPLPHTITLSSPITVMDRTVIDGRTQPGFSGGPVVTIRSQNVAAMRFWGTNSVVRGLAFTDFTVPAIQLGETASSFGNANAVEGCYFGVDASGTNVTRIAISAPHTHILCISDGNRIGGTNAAARNLFTGHSGYGVRLNGSSNVVQGNFFGTDITGANRLGQLGAGVVHSALSGQIGGATPGAGNVFAFLSFDAVVVHVNREGCEIRGNSMFANGGAGILIGAAVNDPGDIDDDFDAGNLGQNFPVLTSVQNLPHATVISGTLHSKSNATFTLDFYANAECDPSGRGEGKRYLGFTQVTTDGAGNASFNFTPTIGSATLDAAEIVTATATDAAGNTSEFSECSGVASSIGGQISDSGTPLSGATINLFGARTGTTNSDANGNFTFPGLPAFGAYTVVPAKPGYVFTPQSHSFTNLSTPGIANFSYAVGTYSIRGLVRDAAGNAIAGARVALSGGATQSTISDLRGAYGFSRLPGLANYTLSASRADFSFGPPTNINNLVANRAVNFIGTPPPRDITGHVRNGSGQPVQGVTLQVFPFATLLPGKALQSVQTDAQGLYQFLNLPSNQRYLIRPSSSQFLFTPQSAALLLAESDLTADFTATSAHRISGRVTDAGAGFAGVTVHFTDLASNGSQVRSSTITDANGDYRSPLLKDGADYEIRPASPVVLGEFTPPTKLALNLASDVTDQNFSGTRQNFEISGVVLNSAGLAMPGVSVALAGSAPGNLEDVYGTFSFMRPGASSYTITPTRAGFSFSPSSITINLLTNNQQVEFRASPVTALAGRIAFLDEVPLVMNADSTGTVSEQTATPSGTFIDFCPPGFSQASGTGECEQDTFDADELLDQFEATVSTLREFTAVALSPDSRQFAFIESTTIFTDLPLPNQPATTEVIGRLLKRDVDRLSPPVELATGAFFPRISWSANGARIAFARPSGPEHLGGIYVIDADGTIVRVQTFPGEPRDPALSPDGNRLAFAAKFDDQYKIYLRNVKGSGDLQRLTLDAGDYLEPAWSPDGQYIACARKRGSDFEIAVIDVHDRQEVELTGNTTDDREPAWSPDGTRIAFTRNGIIHVMTLAATPTVIPLRRGTSPSWGADPVYTTPVSSTLGQDVAVNAGGVTIIYNSVVIAGETIVTPIAPVADPTEMPEGYFSVGETDYAFEITTTASVLAPISVCLRIESIHEEALFNQLSILHNEEGVLQDVTASRDFPTRRICGSVNSLSPFRLAMKIDPALPLIQGRIVNQAGQPVPGAVVVLSGAAQLHTSSDNRGEFTFGNLASGSDYSVTPFRSDYAFTPNTSFVESLTGTNSLVFAGKPFARPQFRITPDAQHHGIINLTWPIESWPFTLEGSDSLTSANWVPVTNPVVAVGGRFIVPLQASSPLRFFRLRRN